MDTGYDPSGILPFSGVATDSYFSKYWQEIDKSITVPVDQWNKLEIYIYRHPKNGIVLSAINDQIVCFHVGRTLGEFGYKWGRLFPFLLYSGTGDTSGEMCRPRFRDYPPAGSVLQMPASKLLDRYAD